MREEVENVMTTAGRLPKRSRWTGLALVGALLLTLAGDGIGAGGIRGIDPLDVLDLQVKPNVFIVLDTSGSMQETLYQNSGGGAVNFNTGDWRESKMGLAKTVLTQMIQQNVTRASFLFGQYTQAASVMQRTSLAEGAGRFRYLSYVNWQDADDDNVVDAGDALVAGGGLSPTMRTACAAPWTTPCELVMAGRGLQAWQNIQAGWNTFYFSEQGQAAPGFCTVTIPTGFYQTGALLATAIQNGMNACTGRPAPTQTYAAAFNAATGRFSFGVTGTYRRPWTLQWTRTPNNIAGALAAYSGTTGNPQQATYANATCSAAACTLSTQNSLQLLWRDTTFEAEEVNFDPDGPGALPVLDRTTYYSARQPLLERRARLPARRRHRLRRHDDVSREDQPSDPALPAGEQLRHPATVGGAVTFEFGGGPPRRKQHLLPRLPRPGSSSRSATRTRRATPPSSLPCSTRSSRSRATPPCPPSDRSRVRRAYRRHVRHPDPAPGGRGQGRRLHPHRELAPRRPAGVQHPVVQRPGRRSHDPHGGRDPHSAPEPDEPARAQHRDVRDGR